MDQGEPALVCASSREAAHKGNFTPYPMASNSVFSELIRGCKLDVSNFTAWKRKIMYLLTRILIMSLTFLNRKSQTIMPVMRKREAIC